MKSLVIFAAVVMLCQTAKVPAEVAVPVPSTILTAPAETEIPAPAVPVSEDHMHKIQEQEEVTITEQPEMKSMIPIPLEITTLHGPLVEKDIKRAELPLQRSMSSILASTQPSTVQSVKATENSNIKPTDASSTASTIDPCDLLCTKFEFEPICATNGLCLHEFPNQCILETFNCRHPKGKFIAAKDDRCQMDWLAKCNESDMI